ncbi:uncharacterized protein [Diadema setosum]|uniref:uncharacterized protein isoform X1 n=1 Tax=Diadema setosum TaxID=31175 RepID=UPI003B3B2B9F
MGSGNQKMTTPALHQGVPEAWSEEKVAPKRSSSHLSVASLRNINTHLQTEVIPSDVSVEDLEKISSSHESEVDHEGQEERTDDDVGSPTQLRPLLSAAFTKASPSSDAGAASGDIPVDDVEYDSQSEAAKSGITIAAEDECSSQKDVKLQNSHDEILTQLVKKVILANTTMRMRIREDVSSELLNCESRFSAMVDAVSDIRTMVETNNTLMTSYLRKDLKNQSTQTRSKRVFSHQRTGKNFPYAHGRESGNDEPMQTNRSSKIPVPQRTRHGLSCSPKPLEPNNDLYANTNPPRNKGLKIKDINVKSHLNAYKTKPYLFPKKAAYRK